MRPRSHTTAVTAALALSLSHVSKTYGTRAPVTAVNDGSFDVAARTRLAITGPSGSGKSTLLNLIGGLDSPTSGSIVVAGIELAHLNEHDRSLLRRTTVA